jgi:ATP-binding cassette subfamily F protein 3
VEELLLVHDGKVEEYRDDLSAYERWILSTYRQDTGSSERATDNSRRGKRQAAAAKREQLRPLRQKVSATEAQMAETDLELTDVETRLADNLIYSDEHRAELESLMKRQGELRTRATALEEQWLSLQEALEVLESDRISC